MKVIIGLEVHVQLNTKTKMFCSCPIINEAPPNTSVCDSCLGMPGSKPRLNKAVIEKALRIALALKSRIPDECFFSRKSYFYPDMSKNYQITQFEIPVSLEGELIINVQGKDKKIRIRRINLEEDPAKLVHSTGDITTSKYTLIDYNRSGVPLCEIVTEPDLSSPEEAREFLIKLLSILEHLGVYEINTSVLKIDANINIEGAERVEVKNITGFKAVEKALSYEIIRQKNVLAGGGKVSQETRHFDMRSGLTHSLRTKETEADYGYIFEPDLSWVELGVELVNEISKNLPELPDQRIERFMKEFKISRSIASALILTEKTMADFFEECIKTTEDKTRLANFLITDFLKLVNYHSLSIKQAVSNVKAKDISSIINMILSDKISGKIAKEVIKEYFETLETPERIVKNKNLKVIKDEGSLEKTASEVIKENPEAVKDYKAGQDKALNFLVGQVMRKTRGQADPHKITNILKEVIK